MRPLLSFITLPTSSDELRQCFDIPIINDNTTESSEEFVVRLERIAGFTPTNVEFTIPEASIRIIDDDAEKGTMLT